MKVSNLRIGQKEVSNLRIGQKEVSNLRVGNEEGTILWKVRMMYPI